MKQMVFKHALLAACFMGSLGSAALADEGSLILPDQVDGSVALLLQGEMGDVAPSDVMQVYVGNPDACCTGKSPIAGRYRVENQLVVFDPAFDFVAGQSYTVRSHEGTLTGFTIGRDNAFIQPEVLALTFPKTHCDSTSTFPPRCNRMYQWISSRLSAQMVRPTTRPS